MLLRGVLLLAVLKFCHCRWSLDSDEQSSPDYVHPKRQYLAVCDNIKLFCGVNLYCHKYQCLYKNQTKNGVGNVCQETYRCPREDLICKKFLCAPKKRKDEIEEIACDVTHPCKGDMDCIDSRCVAPSTGHYGDFCKEGRPCKSGLVCHVFLCIDKPPFIGKQGDFCDKTKLCLRSLVCQRSVCTYIRKKG